MSLKNLYSIAAAALVLNAPHAFGWGLVTPNGASANQYHQVLEGTLVRFDCPDGEVPTGSSCSENRTKLGLYKKIRDSLAAELNGILAKLSIDMGAETSKLKEADPKTITLRQEVRDASTKSDALQLVSLKTEQRISATKKNIALIAAELKLVGEGLKKDPSEAELRRLLERQKRYESLNTQFTTQLVDLEKELAVNRAERGTLAQLILSTNQALDTHLAALKVSSPALTKLELSNAAYSREAKLVPELDARLESPVAFELSEWTAPAAPELFARMLKHVKICSGT
jgi:hypothetical protein